MLKVAATEGSEKEMNMLWETREKEIFVLQWQKVQWNGVLQL